MQDSGVARPGDRGDQWASGVVRQEELGVGGEGEDPGVPSPVAHESGLRLPDVVGLALGFDLFLI